MEEGNIYKFNRIECKREKEVISWIIKEFNGLKGNGKEIEVYMDIMDRKKRKRKKESKDKKENRKMSKRVVSKGRIKGREIMKRNGRDIMGFMEMIKEKGERFLCWMKIKVKKKGRWMNNEYGKYIDRIKWGLRFRMKDRRKSVENIIMINIG